MAKERFIDHRFGDATRALIEKAEELLDEYESEGYDVTLRQLYYRFIALDLFPDDWMDVEYNKKNGLDPDTKNTDKNYGRFGDIMGNARLAGLLDWKMFSDRGREAVSRTHFTSVAEFLDPDLFTMDLWGDQENYVECMVEKQALEGVLIPVCRELDITFTANKGYSSLSALYEAGKRLRSKRRQGREVHVIYLGDHDPSGIDMTRNVEEQLSMFSKGEVTVHRVALNMDQIKARGKKAPPNPVKLRDARSKGYVERFGNKCWELDALEARDLAEIVRKAVTGLRNTTEWNAAIKRQEAIQEELRKIVERFENED
jgi:hypothetical protein